MKNQKEVRISFWAAHATTIVSVTLVLLIVGIIAMVSITAERETRRLKEQIEMTVVMADSVSDASTSKLVGELKSRPCFRSVVMVSRAEALRQWKEDTGEDLEALFGVNPLSPEITVALKAEYASPDSISKIVQNLSKIPGVDEVAAPDSGMVTAMNENITALTTILGITALVLLIISFVLINNTVHLTVYARRFTIHTMRLVGATNRFIRMPVVLRNMLAGIVAGLLASAVIAVALATAPKAGMSDVADYISWPIFGIISACLVLLGALLCSIAASISTQRYLLKDYDKLFR